MARPDLEQNCVRWMYHRLFRVFCLLF